MHSAAAETMAMAGTMPWSAGVFARPNLTHRCSLGRDDGNHMRRTALKARTKDLMPWRKNAGGIVATSALPELLPPSPEKARKKKQEIFVSGQNSERGSSTTTSKAGRKKKSVLDGAESDIESGNNKPLEAVEKSKTKRVRKKKKEIVSPELGEEEKVDSSLGTKKSSATLRARDQDSFIDEYDTDTESSYGSGTGSSKWEEGLEGDDRIGSENESISNLKTKQVLDNWSQEDIILGLEYDIRLLFMESIMERARNGDVEGVEEALLEMEMAGVEAGPRAYHGLVVVYTRAGDAEGAIQAFQRELACVKRPLPETFIALARLFGSLGQVERGQDILGAMEEQKYNPRDAWIILIDELQQAGYLEEANSVFFKGADGGMTVIPKLYDVLIEKNAKLGEHGNALNIVRSLEYSGLQPTTLHYNCLLMCQAKANIPHVVGETFETMQYGPDEMKPDTESYNWLLEANIRHEYADRLHDVVHVVGEMVEDYKRVQPNKRTYSLLIECFVRHNVASEAVRHFRALSQIPGGMQYLHNEGENGDPLSLYLRSSCLQGRAPDLLDALEAMVRDEQPIPQRAMFVNKKGRTLVSSWIEPIAAEADLGYEIDYIARYVAEGGSDGTRKRWSDVEAHREDSKGFAFTAPLEVSFKQHCVHLRQRYTLKLIRKLTAEGVLALGPGATDEDVVKVMAKLRKDTMGDMSLNPRKPKGASKMVVSELKEELEAQGLPTDGTRPVLYQRVQKARRINRARGRPLWLPEIREEVQEEDGDTSVDKFMARLNLENDNTEFWRKRLVEDPEIELFPGMGMVNSMVSEDTDSDDGEDDDDVEEEDVEEETGDFAEDGIDDEDPDAAEFLALKLMKQKSELAAQEKMLDDGDVRGQWLDLTFEEKVAKVRKEKMLDPSDIYTIADVWGWTWEKEIRAKEPRRWSQEWEVQLGMQIMQKVLDLGSFPTIGDCAMLVHAAMRIPWPEAIVSIIQQTHKLDLKFGSKLYNEIVKLFITVGEKDAAIAVITEMEDMGISAPSDLITTVLMESSLANSESIS